MSLILFGFGVGFCRSFAVVSFVLIFVFVGFGFSWSFGSCAVVSFVLYFGLRLASAFSLALCGGSVCR